MNAPTPNKHPKKPKTTLCFLVDDTPILAVGNIPKANAAPAKTFPPKIAIKAGINAISECCASILVIIIELGLNNFFVLNFILNKFLM